MYNLFVASLVARAAKMKSRSREFYQVETDNWRGAAMLFGVLETDVGFLSQLAKERQIKKHSDQSSQFFILPHFVTETSFGMSSVECMPRQKELSAIRTGRRRTRQR